MQGSANAGTRTDRSEWQKKGLPGETEKASYIPNQLQLNQLEKRVILCGSLQLSGPSGTMFALYL